MIVFTKFDFIIDYFSTLKESFFNLPVISK